MKKGFTLIEMLASIVVLGIIGLIVFPTVNSIINNNKEKIYQSQLEEIRLSTEKWAYENIDLLPTEDYEINNNEVITLTIADLKKAGLLQIDMKNPKTGEIFPNDMIITIKFINNKYVYEIDEDSGTDLNNVDNLTGPTIILNGENIVYVDKGTKYEDLGASITKSTGEAKLNIMYQYDEKEVAEVDTNHARTYTVIYYATDDMGTSKAIRTVIVKDNS